MSNKSVKKAIIGAAGFGTRFLPQTKALPKEMLPIVDKPIIQYVVEELVEAGIEDIFIHVRSNKRSIEDHFDLPSQELVDNLLSGGQSKKHFLDEVNEIAQMANFIFVRVRSPYGNAAPVHDASHLIGDEPFIYTYADDFIVAKPESRFRQMIKLHEERGGSIISCVAIDNDNLYKKYGIIGGEDMGDGLYKTNKIIEKPGKDAAPSNLASVSSYLFEPAILKYIESGRNSIEKGKEFYIQPAMQAMMDDGFKFWGLEIKNGTYYDTGDKLEYVKTVVDFALEHKDISKDFRDYLQTIRL